MLRADGFQFTDVGERIRVRLRVGVHSVDECVSVLQGVLSIVFGSVHFGLSFQMGFSL